MMDTSSRQNSGYTFSARRFFEQCARGETESAGRIPFQVELLESGTIQSAEGHGSLVLIDGLYADALSQEKFLEMLQSGEIPRPVIPKASRALHSKILCALPDCLLTTAQTILSGCGLVPYTINMGLNSPVCMCSRCGSRCRRYTSPGELLNAIASDWLGNTISLYIESEHDQLTEWANSQGLHGHTTETGLYSVRLDHILCDTETIVSLSALVHSAWRVPYLRFTCADSGKKSLSYSPSGWCPSCKTVGSPISSGNLRSIVTRGLNPSIAPLPEALLFVDKSTTVEQLLSTPLRELHLEESSTLHRASVLLRRFSLSELSFGSRTDTLGARELAIVSLVSCLITSTGSREQLLLDLPNRLLTDADIGLIRAIQRELVDKNILYFLGNSLQAADSIDESNHVSHRSGRKIITIPAAAGATPGTHDIDLHIGELVRVPHIGRDLETTFSSLIARLSSALEAASTSAQLIGIPVFRCATKNHRVFGEALGLVEPLAQLYASSLDARIHGLTLRDFSLFGARSHRYRCYECRGLGVTLTYNDRLPRPIAAPCTACRGRRCKDPVASALFRGSSFSSLLNRPISQSLNTLAVLSKAKRTLQIIEALDLHHLPLGMPIALLSRSEHRRFLVAQAIQQSRASKPVIVVFEEPQAGFSANHYQAIRKVRDTALLECALTWIETYQGPGR